MRRCFIAVLVLTLMGLAAATISSTTITLSGISAGACFTVQYQIAHSAKIRAAGVIAGTPFYCAGGSVDMALECMSNPLTIDLPALNFDINESAATGFIDNVWNIGEQAVMLFSGTIDSIVNHGTMELLALQYEALGVGNLVAYFNYTAEHSWITNDYGSNCTTLGEPYMNNCGLDFAGEFLRMAWHHMGVRFDHHRGVYTDTHMKQFNQTYFGADVSSNSLARVGYYYVPTRCQNGSEHKCHVHVNFHGCQQQADILGKLYVAHTGLNEWAEANDIIVIYPQVSVNELINPKACFDWWGYAGSNYASKQGVQMVIIDSIVEYLIANAALPAAD
jgi:poly(3-hydroxybutyrate) depolymerase